ncbi:MAG: hypothetical protein MK088_18705 [Alteromonas sp.]|nr:hypothetical protein [Alteromonas sp.]
MALTTYAELQASVADWLNRTDLTTQIVDFITLAEADMNLVLVENKMETTATVAIASGLGTLPDDCLDILTVTMPNGDVLVPETDREADKFESSGTSEAVTVSGSSLRIIPPGDASYNVTLRYRQKVPALSDSNTSNWVLESHPNAYLFGALAHGESFLVNEEKEQEYRSKFAIALNGIAGRDIQRMVHGAQMTSAAGVSIG